MFAGLQETSLPDLEIALFPDRNLHGEFITARIEALSITLQPGLVIINF